MLGAFCTIMMNKMMKKRIEDIINLMTFNIQYYIEFFFVYVLSFLYKFN